jgi:hypothetical protein
MWTYLLVLGFDIWLLVMTGYIAPKNPPIDNVGKNASEHNEKAMNSIFCGLSEKFFVKVMHFELKKYIWDKIQNIYEGKDKVKKEKIQTHRRQFESLKMKDEENVASYFL